MHSQPLPDCWNLDQILDDLNAHGFAIVNQAYSPEYHTQ
ncbi:2OG-Fe(II) oxygenase, partial [Enterobacter asburiae]|nr:2OG-Fe(II) oxygenase [Enterobacter asburiae]